MFSRRVQVAPGVRGALLRVCGLGLHQVRVDGVEPAADRLGPAVSHYDRTLWFEEIDLTDLLTPGDHLIEITLGHGFHATPTPNVWNWHRPPWAGPRRLIAELVLVDDSGTADRIVSDRNWSVRTSGTTEDCYYAGESFDATLAAVDLGAAEPTEGPGGELLRLDHEPVQIAWSGPALSWEPLVQADGSTSWIADFGRTIAGWTTLRAEVGRGATVVLTHAETRRSDGSCRPWNNHVEGDRFQQDRYTGDGSAEQSWEPRFSYKGFRHVQVDGLEQPPGPDTLTAHAAHNAVPTAGEFRCSEPLYEQYVAMMARTVANNLHHIPTDTPMYEKNGWTGDVHVALPSMFALFDLERLMAKWLRDLADAQRPDGSLPVIAPQAEWGFEECAPAPEWTTVLPRLLLMMHRWHDRRDLVEQHWSGLVAYLDCELGRLTDGIATSVLGDWVQPGTDGIGPDDSAVTASGLLVRALGDAAELADLLGETVTGDRFRAAAADITSALNAQRFDAGRGYYVVGEQFSQTSNVLPLALQLVPSTDRATVLAAVVADLAERGDHHQMGCIGLPFLLPTLSGNGHDDLAHRLARQRSYPSWGHFVAVGGDTMFESWEESTRSRNHYFLGTIVQWLVEDVVGLREPREGWRRFEVARTPSATSSRPGTPCRPPVDRSAWTGPDPSTARSAWS